MTVDTADTKEHSLLAGAIWRGDTATIQELVDQGVAVNEVDGYGSTPLILAVIDGNIDAVRMLIKLGANVNLKSEDGDTALSAATRKNDGEMAALLLSNGASLYERGSDGYTPLAWAIKCDCRDIVEKLLERGVDPEEKDDQGLAAVDFVTLSTGTGIKQLLAEAVETIKQKFEAAAVADGHALAVARRGRLMEHRHSRPRTKLTP